MLNMTKIKMVLCLSMTWLAVKLQCRLLVRLFNEWSYAEMNFKFHTLPHGATYYTAHKVPSIGQVYLCAQHPMSLC